MNGTDHQTTTTTQARADIRALLADVPDKLDPNGKWFPGRGLGLLADLLIGKWYACDPARRQGNGVEWPPGDLSKMADDVNEALTYYVGDDSRYLEDYTAANLFDKGDSWGFADIIDWLRGLDLSTPAGGWLAADVFDEAMRFMVHRHGETLGQFVTPAPVVDLMVALADPAPGEKVCDPCFGFGGLLVEALRRTRGATDASSPGQEVGPAVIAGIESDWRAYPVGLCRLVLAGVDRPDLTCGDALVKPLPDDRDARGYDCILAAPPWGDDEEKADRIEDRFLRHVMEHLRPGGRAVIALPERTRIESTALWKELLEEYRVDRVILLPLRAFEPHTSIAMNLVVFRRAEPRDTARFVFISSAAWDAVAAEVSVGAGPNESGFPTERRFDAEALHAIYGTIGRRGELPAGMLSSGVAVRDVPLDEVAAHYSWRKLENLSTKLLDSWIDRIVAADPSLPVERLDTIADGLDLIVETIVEDEEYAISNTGEFSGDLIVTKYVDDDQDITIVGGEVERIQDLYTRADPWRTMLFRVRDGIKPQFVAAILSSPACRNWMLHAVDDDDVLVRALNTLRIPVPPTAVQDSVLDELDGPGADALAVLHRLVAEVSGHAAALWLEKPLPARLVADGFAVSGARDGLRTLAEIGRGLGGLSQSADSTKGSQPLDAWLSKARRAAAALDGIDSIPPSAGRLAILEFVMVRLHEALAALGDAEGHVIERLRSVTRALMRLAEHEASAMQRPDPFEIDVEPVEVVAGDASEVIIRATNASAVPLRNVQLVARCPDGTVEEMAADYVAERGTHDLPIAVRPTGEERSLQIAVEWRARRFDGKPVGDEGAVSLLVRDNRAQYGAGVEAGDLGPNPYITGDPVAGTKLFLGREGVMERIRRQLGASDHANVVLLEGTRRTGKTSILKQIEKTDVLDGWIPVYCSLQGMGVKSTRDFYRALAMETGSALYRAGVRTWLPGTPAPSPGQRFTQAFRSALDRAFSDEHSFETFGLYLAAAVEAAKPRRVLLMLDEFDELQERIDDGTISPQVPTNIRHLLQHQPGVCAIITGSRRLKRLREDYWSALFGLGYRIGISALPIDAAKRLVIEPVEGKLRYLPSACDRVVELCSCHPFLVQLLSSRVFDRVAAGEDRTIDKGVVERAATDMVGDNEHFRTLWGYAGTERRKLVLMLCSRLAEGRDPVNLDLLGMALEERGVEIRGSTDLADDIAELRELELLDFDDSYRGGTYRIAVPLMAMWLQQNIALDELVARARLQARD